jgi:hypothetical protein
MTTAGAIGGGVGASYIIAGSGGTLGGVATSLGSTAAVTVGAAAATGLAASALAGAAAGTAIYENLPTSAQDFIGGRVVAPVVNFVSNAAYSAWSGISSMFGGSVGGGSGGEKAPKAVR